MTIPTNDHERAAWWCAETAKVFAKLPESAPREQVAALRDEWGALADEVQRAGEDVPAYTGWPELVTRCEELAKRVAMFAVPHFNADNTRRRDAHFRNQREEG
jgi:hypothetical protein